MQDVPLYLVGLPLACIDLDQQKKSQLAARAWMGMLNTAIQRKHLENCVRNWRMWVKIDGMSHDTIW